jgi:hypothetical protein
MRTGVWLLGLSLLAAQELPPPPGAPAASSQPEVKSEDQCNVEGTVLNARTKAPLAKAQVRLIRLDGPAATQNATTTDASGRFKLNGVQPGEYRALASRGGFVRQVFGSGKIPTSLTLAPKQTLTGLTLELSPGAVIAGRVVDEDGEPLANVQIQPFRSVNSQGSRQLLPAGRSASTDDQGGYRLFDLDSGRYYVSAVYSARAVPAGGAIPAGAADEGVALAFYPGAVDPNQAVPIQLHAGEERRGVDFRLAPPHGIHIRGRLAPPLEQPQDAVLTLAPLDGGVAAMFASGPRPPVRIDASGAFEFRGVTAGSYLLMATWNRDGNPLRGRLLVEAASNDIDGLELALKPAVELRGRVRLDGDSHPNLDLTKLTVTLTPVQAIFGPSGPRNSALDAGGFFRFPNVFEGDYLVRIGAPGDDTYLRAVNYGGADASGKPLTVGEAPGTLELVLGVDGGQVQGTVTDGDKPVADALVTAVPESGQEDLVKAGRTGPSGRFSLHGLAPGDYTIYAFDDVPEESGADPDGVKAYRDKGKKITVEEKGRATADLALIHTQGE